MKPYFEENGIVIYNADCREVLPTLPEADAIITDPVWPDNRSTFFAHIIDPTQLFAEAAAQFRAKRLVVQLGCDSDPRFLIGVPRRFPFLRVCWLTYPRPSYKGRLLYTGDVAYAYGEWPIAKPGRAVIGGECISTRADYINTNTKPAKQKSYGMRGEGVTMHPAPRRTQHVLWLVSTFCDGLVIDPFCGSGTTLWAAFGGKA